MKYFSTPNGNIYRLATVGFMTFFLIGQIIISPYFVLALHASGIEIPFPFYVTFLPFMAASLYFALIHFYDIKFNNTHLEVKNILGSTLIPLDQVTSVDIGFLTIRLLTKHARTVTFTTSGGRKVRCISLELTGEQKVSELPEYKELMKYIEEQSREY